MQQQLLSTLSAVPTLVNLAPWGSSGVSFLAPHSDDPSFVTVGAGGMFLVWWGRTHVDVWAQSCRDEGLAMPREELIATSAHHAYTEVSQLVEVINYWAFFAKLPA